MAADEWVIDTQILEIASAGDDPLTLPAAALLHAILERHYLALDAEQEIFAEYSRHLRRGTLAAEWWRQLTLRGKLVSRSNKLTNAQRRALTRLKFDTTDWKFVGVASRTPSRLLVAEESDHWQPDVAHYIQNDMRIALLRVRDAEKRTHA